MTLFSDVLMAPPDPVLNLNVLYKKDTNPKKVNLGVGAYKTDHLLPWVFPAVRKAEEKLFNAHLDHEYLPIEGDSLYNQLSLELILGKNFIHKDRVSIVQTIGGTSALKLASDFLMHFGPKTIYISNPTWPNHKNIFGFAGLNVEYYPYYDIESQKFCFDEFLHMINKMIEGSIIVLHGACHNPTGIDPTKGEWLEILNAIKKKNLLPFFDSAYQGLSKGIEEDAYVMRLFLDHFEEMIIASSYSKNFGLYGERAGSLIVLSKTKEESLKTLSQLKVITRVNFSSPVLYGARIVGTILNDPMLKTEWEDNVRTVRDRIKEMRLQLYDKLTEKLTGYDFSSIIKQNGMFSFCGLKKEQVDRLINEYSIYLLSNGRISIAGLSTVNLDYVVDAIVSVF